MFRMDQDQLAALLESNPSLSVSQKSASRAGDKNHITSDDNDAHQKADRQNKYKNYPVFVFQDGYVWDTSEYRITNQEIKNEKTALEKLHGSVTERFDSKKEYVRYGQLKILEAAGGIQDLKRQVSLEIQPAVVYQDEKLRAITYCADFVYTENGRKIVEDVKGYDKRRGAWLTTQTFNLKWKLLKAKYPNYTFRIV